MSSDAAEAVAQRVANTMQGTGRLLVSARGLGVRRDGRWLVRGIDLAVRKGEIVTLIGPNGGGKSTTVRAMLGLIAHEEGVIDRAAGLTVGYMPQRLSIDRTLPLKVRRLMTLTGHHGEQEIRTALGEVGAEHLADAEVHTLSGGEFQRVLLARAIIREPGLLVLDEPVQGVDFAGEVALYRLIGRIRDRLGCGILLISHDLHIVMAATDTVVCLNGHVCCQGSAKSVSESPEYHRLFGHRAAETLAVYRHRHDHAHDRQGNVVAIRPDTDAGCAACHEHEHDHEHDHGHDHGHDSGAGGQRHD